MSSRKREASFTKETRVGGLFEYAAILPNLLSAPEAEFFFTGLGLGLM